LAVHHIRKGLDLPISGHPNQTVEAGASVREVAILAEDFPFMKPRMLVAEGDTVLRGQKLFEDRKTPGVFYTAPGAGTVKAVNRGERRALISVVIELDSRDTGDDAAAEVYAPVEGYTQKAVAEWSAEELRAVLVESGMWTSIRQRPYSKVPGPDEVPAAIFVTAMDSNPLAPAVGPMLDGNVTAFRDGLNALAKLTEGPVFVCKAAGASVPAEGERVQVEEFAGPHPAGLPGTHIHVLHPVGPSRQAWYVGLQDCIAIGDFLATGKVPVERIVSLAGPGVKTPRLVKTRLGANLSELTSGELLAGEMRVISGSVLSGYQATTDGRQYLGRYHQSVTCLAEDRERQFLGWLGPGVNKFSTIRAFASRWLGVGTRRFDFTTTTNGSHRAMVPIGMFERVMPLDILPTFLLRSLMMDDVERAVSLGALELDEEDLGLCTFVSPGKEDYGKALRRNLFDIWKNG
jgi:Na+-transporting NADH:ubiquinone oxidoreductase subunit A